MISKGARSDGRVPLGQHPEGGFNHMCDYCGSDDVKRGMSALEALANGEEIPEPQAEVNEVQVMDICLPFPVMITITESGMTGIITNREGGEAIRDWLTSIGRPPGQCGHDHG